MSREHKAFSFSTDLRHVSFGRPLLLFQVEFILRLSGGVHLKATLGISDVSFLRTWLIHFHLFLLSGQIWQLFELSCTALRCWSCLARISWGSYGGILFGRCLVFVWWYLSPSRTQTHKGGLQLCLFWISWFWFGSWCWMTSRCSVGLQNWHGLLLTCIRHLW